MANPDERKNKAPENPVDRSQADLSARLRRLDDRLEKATAGQRDDGKPVPSSTSDQGALGQAFRLSAEFVSGPIAGALLGWGIDKLFGSSPWGLVVCLLLGFGAGMLNLARSAGVLPRRRGIGGPDHRS